MSASTSTNAPGLGLETDAMSMKTEPCSPVFASSVTTSRTSILSIYTDDRQQSVTSIPERTEQEVTAKFNEHSTQISRSSVTSTIHDHTQDVSEVVSNFLPEKNIITDVTNTDPLRYDTSVTGAILQPAADKNQVFNYVEHGNTDSFQKVLETDHKSVIQMRNDREQTLLHVVVIHLFQYVYVRLLLMRNADPCARDRDGYTPAHYAVEKDDVEMLKALTVRFHATIKAIPDTEVNSTHKRCRDALAICENRGMTAFMLACFKQAINCARYIHGIQMDDADRRDIHGDISLHYAVGRNDMVMTVFLITECNANVNGGDEKRPSPLDIATFNNHSELKEFLLKNNAKSRCLIKRIIHKRKDVQQDIEAKLEGLTIAEGPSTNIPTRTIMSSLSLETDSPEPKKKKSTSQLTDLVNRIEEFKKMNDYDNVLDCYLQMINIYIENADGDTPHPDLVKTYNNIAMIYHRRQNYNMALGYYTKALECALKSSNHSGLPSYYGNIGLICAIQNNDEAALENFEKALAIQCSDPQQNQPEIDRLKKFIDSIRGKVQ
ncbi:unnamed protein product [Didymodactylos carnosus]|uniref:Uncharacterized protein n=2 Tax=Didymodactylos carnosus TaxID=1234261 RepID=A0A8S2VWT7_9BILA|nr:unnamed protein product [Didymodactylos carnosus]